MGAPLPLSGQNPLTTGKDAAGNTTNYYQTRQFGVGNVSNGALQFAQAPTTLVTPYLETPAVDLVNAEAQTPVVEESEFFDFDTQVITVTQISGSPTWRPAYNGVKATGSALAAGANATAVLASLNTIPELAALTPAVAQAGTGPWVNTVTFATGKHPIALIQVSVSSSNTINVEVESVGGQQGIVPF